MKILPETVEWLSLYVHPDHVGKGVGTALWNEAAKYLPHDRLITLEVATYTKAVDFYKKLGFTDTGERYAGESMLSSGTQMPLMKMVYLNK